MSSAARRWARICAALQPPSSERLRQRASGTRASACRRATVSPSACSNVPISSVSFTGACFPRRSSKRDDLQPPRARWHCDFDRIAGAMAEQRPSDRRFATDLAADSIDFERIDDLKRLLASGIVHHDDRTADLYDAGLLHGVFVDHFGAGEHIFDLDDPAFNGGLFFARQLVAGFVLGTEVGAARLFERLRHFW